MGDSTMLNDPLVVTAQRRIDAPAAELFAVVADPRRHIDFDGSGMLRGTTATSPVERAGDQFLTQMYYEQFGDYEMMNRVVEFDRDRRISWEPKRHDIIEDDDWHHRWGFDLEADGDATVVTEFFDCSRAPEEALKILKNGAVWREAMQDSLERLDELVTRAT